MTLRRTDLTDDERCVLLNAVEETYMFGVLNECAPGDDWPDRLPHIPHLAQIVEGFINMGLAGLTRDAEESGQRPAEIPDDEARTVIAQRDNWWSSEGARPISLVVTDKGLAMYRGEEVDASRS